VISIKQARAGAIARWLVVLCLALVSISGAVQVLHYHADQLGSTAKECPLCQVLHSAATVVHSVEINISFQTTTYLPIFTESNHQSALTVFALFSRPPPLV
jgi:hypothetical protein